MIHVALLRGINVGGKNKVDMKALAASFERAGMAQVKTYINSGNVIFRHDSADSTELASRLERAVADEFGFETRVLVKDAACVRAIAQALPAEWADDRSAKCDVLFLADELDTAQVLSLFTVKPGIDDVRYVPGAVLWRVERPLITRSGLLRIVGTEPYRKMTVRNCNTLRRLVELVEQAEAAASDADRGAG